MTPPKAKGQRVTSQYRRWTKSEDKRLAELYATHRLADIAEKLGRGVSSVSNRRSKLGLKRSAEQDALIGNGQIRKGNTPWNKGLKGWQAGGRSKETQFKVGNRRGNTWRPVGSERINRDGILIRKVADTGDKKRDWRAVHVVEWERHYGPLPPGKIVVFRDRNRRNFEPENLLAVTRAENMQRNSIDRYPPEYRRAAITLGHFKAKLKKLEKENAFYK